MILIGLIHECGGWILRPSAAMKRLAQFRPVTPRRET
jgi:hypothetical protein